MRAIGLLLTAALLTNAQAYAADAPAAGDVPLVTAQSSPVEVTAAIGVAIGNVKKLRDWLPHGIDHERRMQTRFDSSIILLSIASVAGALYRASLPAIGGIGLAAAGLSQYRAYYNPEAQGLGYMTAARATRCVYSTAEPLLTEQPQLLWQQMANLRLAIAEVQATSAQVDNTTPAGQAGSNAASQALTAANSALSALTAEASAYNSAPGQIDAAHDAIKDYIEKIEHRSVTPDFSAISSQLNAAITAQATSAAQTATARAQLLGAYQAQSNAQAKAPGAANIPAPTAAAPKTLAEASGAAPAAAPPPAAAAAAAPAKTDAEKVADVAASAASAGPAQAAAVNAGQVSALIKATELALGAMPGPQYTTTLTAVAGCVSGLK